MVGSEYLSELIRYSTRNFRTRPQPVIPGKAGYVLFAAKVTIYVDKKRGPKAAVLLFVKASTYLLGTIYFLGNTIVLYVVRVVE